MGATVEVHVDTFDGSTYFASLVKVTGCARSVRYIEGAPWYAGGFLLSLGSMAGR